MQYQQHLITKRYCTTSIFADSLRSGCLSTNNCGWWTFARCCHTRRKSLGGNVATGAVAAVRSSVSWHGNGAMPRQDCCTRLGTGDETFRHRYWYCLVSAVQEGFVVRCGCGTWCDWSGSRADITRSARRRRVTVTGSQ